MSRRVIYPSAVSLGLIGLWAIAASALATIAVTSAGKFYEYQRTSPDYQVDTVALELAPFTKIEASKGRVTIKHGPVQVVEISGRAIERDNTIVEVVDDTLVVRKKDRHGTMCIFCNDDTAEITIETPDLEAVVVDNATARFEDYADSALALEAVNGYVRGALSSGDLMIDADSSNLWLDIATEMLTISGENAHIELEGSAETATISLDDSSFEGRRFLIQEASLTSYASAGAINAQTLTANDDASSRIINIAATSTSNQVE